MSGLPCASARSDRAVAGVSPPSNPTRGLDALEIALAFALAAVKDALIPNTIDAA